MVRDFSDSVKNQIIKVVSDNDGLYTEDISSIDLFACKNISPSDLESYPEEIQSMIQAANKIVAYANSKIEEYVAKLNKMIVDVNLLDDDFSSQIISYANTSTENYISDLRTLVEAISLTETTGSGKTLTANFGEGSIFGSSDAFANELKNVDNKLKDDIYDRIYNEDGTLNDEEIAKIMQQDSLYPWEIEVIVAMVNETYIDENGNLDYEGLEHFIESCYVLAEVPGVLGYTSYELSGAYMQFAESYNSITTTQIMIANHYKDTDVEINVEHLGARATINSLLWSVGEYYDGIFVWGEDSKADINMTVDKNGMIDVSLDTHLLYKDDSPYFEPARTIHVSDFSQYGLLLNQEDVVEVQSQIQEPVDGMEMWGDFLQDQIIGMIPGIEGLPAIGDIYGWVNGTISTYEDISSAQAHQESINEAAETQSNQIYYNMLVSYVDTDYSPMYCNVVRYGDEYTIMNQHFSMTGLEENINQYNANDTDHETDLKKEDVLNAIYNPGDVDLSVYEDYGDYGGSYKG